MQTEEQYPKCSCGKGVHLYSTALGQGFCSDECYDRARGTTEETTLHYLGHGKYGVAPDPPCDHGNAMNSPISTCTHGVAPKEDVS